jgi:hypothetical protein
MIIALVAAAVLIPATFGVPNNSTFQVGLSDPYSHLVKRQGCPRSVFRLRGI